MNDPLPPEDSAADGSADQDAGGDSRVDPVEGMSSDQVQRHVSARVPESVAPGVLGTGIIVMTGANEFVVDFIQGLGQPAQVVARVVVPHAVMPQLIDALERNLQLYRDRYGDPPELPKNPNPQRQPSAQEIYDELKMTDDVRTGAYANGVMIGHSITEFKLDFLANLFPQTAVSARVFMATPQVPRMLESLQRTYQQLLERVGKQSGAGEGATEPPETEPPETEPPETEPPETEPPETEPPETEPPIAPPSQADEPLDSEPT